MAALTWREMTAPDLGTSLKGYDQFTRLLNDSLGGARDAVAGLDQKQKDFTNNQVQLALATTQDPAALKAALADPAQRAKLDPSMLNAQTIAAIGARPGQLIQQANQELQLKDGTRLFDQAVTADQRAPLLAQRRALEFDAGKGDKVAVEKLAAFDTANPDLTNGIGFDKTINAQKGFEEALKGGQDFRIAGNNDLRAWNADGREANRDRRDGVRLGLEQARLNMEQGRYNFELEDRQVKKDADAFMARITASGDPSDMNTILAAITNSGLDKMSGSVQEAVYARVGQRFPNLYQGGDPSGGGVSQPGGAGVLNAATITVGGGQLPPQVQSITDAINYGEKVLIPRTRNSAQFGLQGTGLGTSAMGLYQITAGTLRTWAPKVFPGQDLSKINFTDPVVQDKIAEEIYNGVKNNPTALTKTWTSLSPAEARSIAGKPWEQVRNIIADGESGGRYAGSTAAVQTNMALERGREIQGKSDVNQLVEAGTKKLGPLEAVDMVKANPRFKEASPKFIKEQLEKIVKDGTVTLPNGTREQRITYGQAAIILGTATTENNGSGWGPGGSSLFGGSWDKNVSGRINKAGDRINFDVRDAEVQRIRNSNLGQEAARAEDFSASAKALQAARADVTAASNNYTRLFEKSRYNPSLAQQVDIAKQAFLEKQRRLAAIQASLDTPFSKQGGVVESAWSQSVRKVAPFLKSIGLVD